MAFPHRHPERSEANAERSLCADFAEFPLGNRLGQYFFCLTLPPWGALSLGSFAEDDAHTIPPAFIDSDQGPIDFWRKIMQHSIGSWVDVQSRGHQEKQGFCRRKFSPGKVAELLELAASVMPLDAGPVIEPLEREMDILVCFQFHDRHLIRSRDGKNVEHGTVGSGEGGDLRVEAAVIQTFVDGADVAHYKRLEPAFGMQPPKSLVPGTLRTACAT